MENIIVITQMDSCLFLSKNEKTNKIQAYTGDKEYHSSYFYYNIYETENNLTKKHLGSLFGFKIIQSFLYEEDEPIRDMEEDERHEIISTNPFYIEMEKDSDLKGIVAETILSNDCKLVDSSECIFVIEDFKLENISEEEKIETKKIVFDNIKDILKYPIVDIDISSVIFFIKKENLEFYKKNMFQILANMWDEYYLVFKKII